MCVCVAQSPVGPSSRCLSHVWEMHAHMRVEIHEKVMHDNNSYSIAEPRGRGDESWASSISQASYFNRYTILILVICAIWYLSVPSRGSCDPAE